MEYTLTRIKFLAVTLLLPLFASAQSVETDEKNGSIAVTGTSSLHDWEMVVTEFQASADISEQDDGNYLIENAEFRTKAENLESDKSLMNSKAHDALEAEDHPEISFRQTGNTRVPANGSSSMKVEGNLKIAGSTNPVKIRMQGSVNNNGHLTIMGKKSLKMTDFGIDPPTALFGTVKSGDELTVNFDLKLK